MSSTQWITAGLPIGSESGGVVTPGGCRAIDMVATRVRQKLAAREELAAIFPGRILRHRTRPILQGLVEPRLYVYPVSASPEARPTELEITTLRLFVGTFWPMPGEDFALEDWEPSVGSLAGIIRGTLHESYHLATYVADGGSGTEVQFVQHSRPADEAFFRFETSRGSYVEVHEMAWHFELRIDPASGQLDNVHDITG